MKKIILYSLLILIALTPLQAYSRNVDMKLSDLNNEISGSNAQSYFDLEHKIVYFWIKTAFNTPQLIEGIKTKQVNTLIEVDCYSKTLNEVKSRILAIDENSRSTKYKKDQLEINYNNSDKKLLNHAYLPNITKEVCGN